MREFFTRNLPMGATACGVGFFAASMLKVPNPLGGSTLFSQVLTRGWDFLVSGGDIASLFNHSRSAGYLGGNLAVRLIATLITGTKPDLESMIKTAAFVSSLSTLVGLALTENPNIQPAQNPPRPQLT